MSARFTLTLLLNSFVFVLAYSQKIVDPCFLSVTDVGFYYGSNDNSNNVVNVCNCNDRYLSTDMLVWNGTSWKGMIWFSYIDIAPPPGCNQRAIWMGPPEWTRNGEAVGLRLDNALEAGKKVSFKFTYASTGNRSDGNFEPMVYTTNSPPISKTVFTTAHKVDRLPVAHNSWHTDSISFIPTQAQNGDQWLIIHCDLSSGIILGDCNFGDLPKALFSEDSIQFCRSEPFTQDLPSGEYYTYSWNTGSTKKEITISEPGNYIGKVQYGLCSKVDTIVVIEKDCEVRLELPNVFTPNNDAFNNIFKPIEYNFLSSAILTIFNRWGEQVFKGDLFIGWDGKINGTEASPGIYFYKIIFTDQRFNTRMREGPLTLIR